jgi:hypothetical protein
VNDESNSATPLPPHIMVQVPARPTISAWGSPGSEAVAADDTAEMAALGVDVAMGAGVVPPPGGVIVRQEIAASEMAISRLQGERRPDRRRAFIAAPPNQRRRTLSRARRGGWVDRSPGTRRPSGLPRNVHKPRGLVRCLCYGIPRSQ